MYRVDEIDEFLTRACDCEYRVLSVPKKGKYVELPASFDIETSSFMHEGRKAACMYIWMFGLNGLVLIGRTWDEFLEVMIRVMLHFELGDKKHLIIYVHNLAYEFQFIRKLFEWTDVFALKSRVPVYGRTLEGFEFRCSYILSGYSLAKLGEHLQRYPVQKLVGNLDYTLLRHQATPLTDAELAYCVNDVKVVMAYIQEEIENCGKITAIPLTKTGYVRKFVRNECFFEKGKKGKHNFKRWRYSEMMKRLVLSPDEYQQLKRAFQGGFTHANAFATGKVIEDVTSEDFTSSYPAVMCSRQFPMSAAEDVEITSIEQFNRNLSKYCCLFDVEFTGLRSILWNDSYISISRCWHSEQATINNGRVVSAASVALTITEQDYFIIKRFYSWENMRIGNFRRYKRGYLPRDFVNAILTLYQDKTQLKGVKGKEVEYLKSKEMLNSCYGMCVTDIVRNEVEYKEGEWQEVPANLEKSISEYNEGRGRFLYYPWGVWTTAYARANLFTAIISIGDDYIYSDTDSVKITNIENHQEYFKKYNAAVGEDLKKAMKFQGIDFEKTRPATIKGVNKPLGEWDLDGHYTRFKTLGAKRYMVEEDGEISITVSGLNKKTSVPYIMQESKGEPFEFFDDDMHIPPEHTGKMIHTYIDDEIEGDIVDYLGASGHFHELSCIHLEPAEYSLSMSAEYVDYIFSLE